ncbi:hypothetical protein [Capnocytophaga sp.]|uniref:hypothetical protein n=1 Tax=Capnocytophaga sp. TaxID=44737 RepID=UPI0026DAAAFE|nr:hypothetical protein [Capnocytophaga sp.]MDO5106561.1 hypothetical protein [Capnocytophaga sp.]
MPHEIYTHIAQAIARFSGGIDAYLGCRETPDFDSRWVAAYERVYNSQRNDSEFISNEKSLRENVFKLVFSRTQNSDLAGYISDDAGLIYAGQYLQIADDFIYQLYKQYKNAQLPK